MNSSTIVNEVQGNCVEKNEFCGIRNLSYLILRQEKFFQNDLKQVCTKVKIMVFSIFIDISTYLV